MDEVFISLFFVLFKHVHQKIWSGGQLWQRFFGHITLKAPITTAADDTFCDRVFINLRKNKA